MKVTWVVRDYAAAQGLSEQEALEMGMVVKAVEFVEQGGVFIGRLEQTDLKQLVLK